MKKHIALAFAAALIVSPAAAQQDDDDSSLMEQGLQLFLDGLREEMSPAMENMRQMVDEYGPALFSFFEEMGPAFGEMLEEVKDWTSYHPPEFLPNGDIIIRKKLTPQPESPAPKADEPPPAGQTDL